MLVFYVMREAGLTMEEFFEEQPGEALGVVADDTVFLKEIVEDGAETEFLERGEINGHGFGALSAVAPVHSVRILLSFSRAAG